VRGQSRLGNRDEPGWRIVVTVLVEQLRREESRHVEDVDDPVVGVVAIEPRGGQVGVVAATRKNVGGIEDVDRPVEVRVAGGRVGHGH